VSPAGGDFSEPVTQNTKRFVSAFLSLDKKLAYSRHYPAINWLSSYSGYINLLKDWYEENVSPEIWDLRGKMLKLLYEESKLLEIVKLVGEDVLPDDQRLILETAKIIRVSFLQQNAYHAEDTFVPLEKQYRMLKTIEIFYESAYKTVKVGAPISQIANKEIFEALYKMKYNIPNDNYELLDSLQDEIRVFYENLYHKYGSKK